MNPGKPEITRFIIPSNNFSIATLNLYGIAFSVAVTDRLAFHGQSRGQYERSGIELPGTGLFIIQESVADGGAFCPAVQADYLPAVAFSIQCRLRRGCHRLG